MSSDTEKILDYIFITAIICYMLLGAVAFIIAFNKCTKK